MIGIFYCLVIKKCKMLDSNSATVFRIVSKSCDVYNDCIFWNKIYLHKTHPTTMTFHCISVFLLQSKKRTYTILYLHNDLEYLT